MNYLSKNYSLVSLSTKLMYRATSFYQQPLNLTSANTFHASDLTITKSQHLKPLPEFVAENLAFGSKDTDHMLTIDWSSKNGWGKPKISPLQNISLHRFNSTLHYAIQCFQGLKAYKNEKGQIRLFRPWCNLHRLRYTSRALCLPQFDGLEFLKCFEQLIKLQSRWIPAKRGFSLYVRPTHISMESTLGVKDPLASQLFVVVSPTGPYYPTGFKPIGLYCQTDKIRSAPGGYGQYKMGSNYGPTLLASKRAQANGYSQCLWLFNDQVVEVGASNIFIVFKGKDGVKQLHTPQLDGLILPGVTRDSIIRYVKTKSNYRVIERKIMIQEVIQGLKNGDVLQMFGAGTAVIVSPVNFLGYKQQRYSVPIREDLKAGELTYELFNTMLDIQEGKVSHEWSYLIQ